jgi:hypothetical protein
MRGLGWFLAVVIVVLGFYLVSLQVAAERKKVDDVDRAIVHAERDIRSLETEFNTRASLAQLEKWNGDVLALTAPTAEQFLPDEERLAQIDFRTPGRDGGIRTAAYVVPALPVDSGHASTSAVTPSAPDTRTDSPNSVAPPAAPAPTSNIGLASNQVSPKRSLMPLASPAMPRVEPRHSTNVIAAVATTRLEPHGDRGVGEVGLGQKPHGGRAVAMLDRKLLNDSTLNDLLSRAHIDTEAPR